MQVLELLKVMLNICSIGCYRVWHVGYSVRVQVMLWKHDVWLHFLRIRFSRTVKICKQEVSSFFAVSRQIKPDALHFLPFCFSYFVGYLRWSGSTNYTTKAISSWSDHLQHYAKHLCENGEFEEKRWHTFCRLFEMNQPYRLWGFPIWHTQ